MGVLIVRISFYLKIRNSKSAMKLEYLDIYVLISVKNLVKYFFIGRKLFPEE